MSVDQLLNTTKLEFLYYTLHGKVVWFTFLYSLLLVALEVFKKPLSRFRIQKKYPTLKTMLKEYGLCLSSFLFFLPWYLLAFIFYKAGFYHFYTPWNHFGVVYFIFTILAMIAIHETYHYFYHRFMHTNKFMLSKVHRVHHSFPNPTALTTYAFHPIEAFFHPAIFPFIPLFLPMNLYAALIFFVIAEGVNMLGHHGYEWYGRAFARYPFLRIFNRSTFHNLHHSNGGKTNYGYYTVLWDRWLGTENMKNESRFTEINKQKQKNRSV